MFLSIEKQKQQYTRPSKNGNTHSYTRISSQINLKCDSCQTEFSRPLGKMNKKRLNNEYYHVCSHCDAKRFAQSKGANKRKLWNTSVDSDLNIGDV